MCTHGDAPYLREQLRSIADQSRSPDDVVICDDGSTEQAREIIRQFQERTAFPVRVFQNDRRLGMIRNFEQAVRKANGRVIFLADRDDVWYPGKVGTLLDLLDGHPQAGFAFCDARLIDSEGDELGERISDRYSLPPDYAQQFAARTGVAQLELLLEANHALGTTMAFRSDLKPLLLPFSPLWGQDEWTTHLAAAAGRHGVRHPEPLQDYRLHGEQEVGIPPFPENRLRVRLGRHWREPRLTLRHPVRYIRKLQALRERILERRPVAAATPVAVRIIGDGLAGHIGDVRHTLRRNRIRRGRSGTVRALLGELRAGRYHRHSNGLASVATDLFWWLRSRTSRGSN